MRNYKDHPVQPVVSTVAELPDSDPEGSVRYVSNPPEEVRAQFYLDRTDTLLYVKENGKWIPKPYMTVTPAWFEWAVKNNKMWEIIKHYRAEMKGSQNGNQAN